MDWEAGRIVVPSPKTERHAGKANREIPLFAELLPILVAARDRAPAGAEYVVDGKHRKAANTAGGWRNCNLRTQLGRIIKLAGLEAWPRLLHNLRASRETELAKDFPIHVVTKWLGNTPKIALKHYLQVTEADFSRAAGCAAKSDAAPVEKALQKAVQQPAASSRSTPQYRLQPIVVQDVTAGLDDALRKLAKLLNGEDRIFPELLRISLIFKGLCT